MRPYRIIASAILVFAGAIGECAAQNTITTVAGTGVKGFNDDGSPATNTKLNMPNKVIADAAGNVYVVEMYNHVVRKVDAAGNIEKAAGCGYITGIIGDGGPATEAEIYWPTGVCKDAAGNLYITDAYSNKVRMVHATTGIISTIAGTGAVGFTGDGGPAVNARLAGPLGICVNATGDIFFSEYSNGTVRKITEGIITTIAGRGENGFSGDGDIARLARLNHPDGIAVSPTGELYIADAGSNRIRKVVDGIITTVAGTGEAEYNGDNDMATMAALHNPTDVALDEAGNLYIADQMNHVIRKMDADGVITTFAGKGSEGYTGDNGPALQAELAAPSGITYANDALYIADANNHVVRKVSISPVNVKHTASAASTSVYPNPFKDELFFDDMAGYTRVEIKTLDARMVLQQELTGKGSVRINTSSFAPGMYVVTFFGKNGGTNSMVAVKR